MCLVKLKMGRMFDIQSFKRGLFILPLDLSMLKHEHPCSLVYRQLACSQVIEALLEVYIAGTTTTATPD